MGNLLSKLKERRKEKSGLGQPATWDFNKEDFAFLRQLPEKEAFKLLIDTFRFRLEAERMSASKYASKDSGPEFRKFLDLAEGRKDVMPEWWNKEKRRECEVLLAAEGGRRGWKGGNGGLRGKEKGKGKGKAKGKGVRIVGSKNDGNARESSTEGADKERGAVKSEDPGESERMEEALKAVRMSVLGDVIYGKGVNM